LLKAKPEFTRKKTACRRNRVHKERGGESYQRASRFVAGLQSEKPNKTKEGSESAGNKAWSLWSNQGGVSYREKRGLSGTKTYDRVKGKRSALKRNINLVNLAPPFAARWGLLDAWEARKGCR